MKKKFVCGLCLSICLVGVLSPKLREDKREVPTKKVVIDKINTDKKSNNRYFIDSQGYTMLKDYKNIERSIDDEVIRKNLKIFSEKDERAKYILENLDVLPIGYQRFVANNPMGIKVAMDYIDKEKFPPSIGESIELNRKIPFYLQWDRRWGNAQYGPGVLAYNGCAPTSLAMIFSGLKENPHITPLTVIAEAGENDIVKAGTTWNFIENVGETFGIRCERISYSEDSIKKALDQGKIVMVNVGPGHFTFSGHMLVLLDYDDEGFIMNDVNSYENSMKKWKFEEIKPVKVVWSFEKK